MNECVVMPADAQRALVRATDEVGWSDGPQTAHSKQRSLTELAREWAGPGVHTCVAAVDGDAHTNYTITLSYTVEHVPAAPLSASFWVNLRSGQASWSPSPDATHAMTCNGACTSIDLAMFAPSTCYEYERQRERWATGVQKRIARLEGKLRMATLHAMRHWHESRKKIVRVVTPEGKHIVGLLL